MIAMPRLLSALFWMGTAVATVGAAVDDYPPHPDAVVQPGVPKGELI